MAIFKCKMCGGDLIVNDNEAVCTCEYCGTKQTIPKANDEKIVNLFNRANQLRIVNRFDEALKIYNDILTENNENAEAHWCALLCKYGIEYIDDLKNDKKVPTCHRTVIGSIFSDDDYLEALKYSDSNEKNLYENEAEQINEIQKGILEQVSKSDKYDVFICYKESDDLTGERTKDSVIAQDLFYELVKKGYKVFFSRKTLESKIGSQYEPIIYSALKSAKVMVVLGTRPEYFNSTWLKNEWSRFLDFAKDENKALIPCYRDFSPYDLPNEFSNLQALDMSKIGFMQELIDSIERLNKGTKKYSNENFVENNSTQNTSALIERAYIFLDDKDYEKVNEYCERILDTEPKNSEAYFIKFLAEVKCENYAALLEMTQSDKCKIELGSNYQKAKKFADDNFLSKLNEFENKRNEKLYSLATEQIDHLNFNSAIELLRYIKDYKNSKELIQNCNLTKNKLSKDLDEIETLKHQLNSEKKELANLENTKRVLADKNKMLKASTQLHVDSKLSKLKTLVILSITDIVSKVIWFSLVQIGASVEQTNKGFSLPDRIASVFMFVEFGLFIAFAINYINFRKNFEKKQDKIGLTVILLVFFGFVVEIIALVKYIPEYKNIKSNNADDETRSKLNEMSAKIENNENLINDKKKIITDIESNLNVLLNDQLVQKYNATRN